jgi:hypothetical protein
MREYPFSTLGFNPAYGVGRPEELSGIPDQWLSVVAAKLALRICPMMGATMSTEAKANLASGMALLNAPPRRSRRCLMPGERRAELAASGCCLARSKMMSDALPLLSGITADSTAEFLTSYPTNLESWRWTTRSPRLNSGRQRAQSLRHRTRHRPGRHQLERHCSIA